ncbi:MAG: Helix-turn-helix domain [Herbinix sp.]|jgi:predicted site-specific integrase-resolvase|nr:Helix-turn-helix domain [Herbinix sp.]
MEYEYYTLSQVSERFQVSEATIRRRIKEGKIPKAHFCGRILVPAWFVKQGSTEPVHKLKED